MAIVKTDNRMGETKDENVEKSVSNIPGSILVSGVRSRDDGGKPDLFLVLREPPLPGCFRLSSLT